VVDTASPPRAVELAKRLKAAGAKMYGAFWCSHCFEQKEAFGREAMKDFPYVECYPDGFRQASRTQRLRRVSFMSNMATLRRACFEPMAT